MISNKIIHFHFLRSTSFLLPTLHVDSKKLIFFACPSFRSVFCVHLKQNKLTCIWFHLNNSCSKDNENDFSSFSERMKMLTCYCLHSTEINEHSKCTTNLMTNCFASHSHSFFNVNF